MLRTKFLAMVLTYHVGTKKKIYILFLFCFVKKTNLMHLPPFHKDTGVGLLLALASQNRSHNISKISVSADTNTQKVGGRCYADITTQGTEGVNGFEILKPIVQSAFKSTRHR